MCFRLDGWSFLPARCCEPLLKNCVCVQSWWITAGTEWAQAVCSLWMSMYSGRGPGGPAGAVQFTLNWMTNPPNMIVNILKGDTLTFWFQSVAWFHRLQDRCRGGGGIEFRHDTSTLALCIHKQLIKSRLYSRGGKGNEFGSDIVVAVNPGFLNLPSLRLSLFFSQIAEMPQRGNRKTVNFIHRACCFRFQWRQKCSRSRVRITHSFQNSETKINLEPKGHTGT